MTHIFVDGDGCPVKEEVYRVARRYKLNVTITANAWMRMPQEEWLEFVLVGEQINAADDWIAEHVSARDIVITGDVPLAARCLAKGAVVLDTRGGAFSEERIGGALATRELLSRLREAGTVTRGPAPLAPRDRSRFLQRLDAAVHAVLRCAPPP